ncbi:MAG: hypothetical protein WAW39_28940 [Prosthecobacter sp.]|uniref:hypothetical protein n=1 Tax=Prosthecobacter sp. TaxID=1965333 RepID=UPI003BAE3851
MSTPDLLTPTVTDSGTPVELPGTEPSTNGTPQRNALNFTDRSKLSEWMKLPENKEYVEKQTDAESAIRATNALQIAITAGNITGMRNTLGITKFKPEKPADPPADVDLITLQKQFEATKIDAASTREVVNQLIAHVRHLQIIIIQNSHLLTPPPESVMAEFKDLKPLAPLPG